MFLSTDEKVKSVGKCAEAQVTEVLSQNHLNMFNLVIMHKKTPPPVQKGLRETAADPQRVNYESAHNLTDVNAAS